MRKDAKIGFAIGGVLLAVLTVYVIVVPRHHNAISPNAVTLSIPADMPATDTSSSPATDNGGSAAKTAADSAVAHNSSDGVNWERLLNGGGGDAPPLMTANSVTPSAPVAKDGGITVPGPTPASGVNVSSTPPVVIASDRTPATRPTTPTVVVADPPVRAHAVAAGAAGKQYTIKAGQTLSSIAAEVYGNSRFYVAIIRANPNVSPNHLKPGTQIVLPDASEVNPEASPAAVTTVERTPATGGHSYTVKSGDTLYAISKELFGTPKQADAIYELNKLVIGPNEARLKLGMVLKLPEAPSSPTVSR